MRHAPHAGLHTGRGCVLCKEYDKVRSNQARRAKALYPERYDEYRTVQGKTHIGVFSAPRWKQVGGTDEELVAIKGDSEVVEIPDDFFDVPEDFRKEYNQRPRPDRAMPSDVEREDSPIRNKYQAKHWQDIEPTSLQKAYVLTRLQGGRDAFGVAEGTFFKKGNTYKKTKFHAAHLVSIAEFNDGREHWWNDDRSPNFRMLAEFNNEFESSYPQREGRDAATKANMEKRIVYNILEQTVRDLAADPKTCILEMKVKTT